MENSNSNSSAFGRVSRNSPCPICHKPDWCEVAEDGTVAHCMREVSDRPLDYRGGGWLHFLGRPAAGNWASRARHQPNQNQTGAGLDQARLDLVNRAITRLLGLSNEHAAYIAKQYPGLDPALFGSYQPGRDCYALAGRLSEAGFEQAEILQHPAFKPTEIQNHRDGETMTAIQFAGNEPGLIIPAIDEDEASGLVMGLQIRLEKTPQHGGKYRWVAWPGRGNAPASFLLAQPATATAAKMLLITEGLKKAAQARAHYDCHAVSLPGVAIQPLPQILKWIDRAGVSRVVVAFDADKAENEAVAAQEKRLLDALLVARPGLVLERANWPGAAGKGLDNVLQGGKAGAISFELYAPGDSGKLKADLELNQPFLDYLPTTGKKAALLHSPKGSF